MLARLTVVSGPDQGQTILIDEGQRLTIGRADTAHARLSDPYVSRTHCRVEAERGKVRVIDTGSRSGTLVNGQPITQCELQPGDVLRLAYTELRFELASQDAAGAGPADSPEGQALPGITALLGLVGKRIAQFEMQQKVATGCSGMVYRAHDTQEDRTVALKILWPDMMQDEDAVGRFVRAMKTMLPIRHPNLVELYGAGRTGPYCWIAMEYIDGESLTQAILRSSMGGMMKWHEAFRVAVHVARALQAAYTHEVVHRNINPTNILIRSEDQAVKLGDLLLAKALAGSMARRITQVGELVGEILYLSPEGTGEGETDCRSDVYSLGATVYAVLTGRPPFEGKSLTDVIAQIRQAEPVPPSTFQPGIPDTFERAVLRMLAKRPEDRQQNPTELLRDLDRVGKHEGVVV